MKKGTKMGTYERKSSSFGKTKPRYKKPDAVKLLEQQVLEYDRAKHPSIPPHYIAPTSFRDDTARGLIKCILALMKVSGHEAKEISAPGRRVDRRKSFIDVIGISRRIGTVQWESGVNPKNKADILATIDGWPIEVKVDMNIDSSLSPGIDYQIPFDQAGTPRILVYSFTKFHEWYLKVFGEGRP